MTKTRRLLFALPVLVAVAATPIVVAYRHHETEVAQSRRDDFPADVRAALATKARDAIENGATADHSTNLACAVDLLGTDPPSVTEAGAAKTAYVWSTCTTLGTEVRSGWSIPVAVHFTDPPTAEMPGDGVDNTPDKERIFPRHLWGLVIGNPEGTRLVPQMEQRIAVREGR